MREREVVSVQDRLTLGSGLEESPSVVISSSLQHYTMLFDAIINFVFKYCQVLTL